jgi:hypothetical protein
VRDLAALGLFATLLITLLALRLRGGAAKLL